MSQKRIAIFGSTGSIGKQTLEVIAAHPELFVAEILTAHSNESLLIEQGGWSNPIHCHTNQQPLLGYQLL